MRARFLFDGRVTLLFNLSSSAWWYYRHFDFWPFHLHHWQNRPHSLTSWCSVVVSCWHFCSSLFEHKPRCLPSLTVRTLLCPVDGEYESSRIRALIWWQSRGLISCPVRWATASRKGLALRWWSCDRILGHVSPFPSWIAHIEDRMFYGKSIFENI